MCPPKCRGCFGELELLNDGLCSECHRDESDFEADQRRRRFEHDRDVMMIRSADGRVHAAPIELR